VTALTPTPPPPEPEAHDAAWFAARIGMGLDWVRHNMHSIPHRRYGRRVRFTEEDVATFLERHAVDPTRVQRSPLSRKKAPR